MNERVSGAIALLIVILCLLTGLLLSGCVSSVPNIKVPELRDEASDISLDVFRGETSDSTSSEYGNQPQSSDGVNACGWDRASHLRNGQRTRKTGYIVSTNGNSANTNTGNHRRSLESCRIKLATDWVGSPVSDFSGSSDLSNITVQTKNGGTNGQVPTNSKQNKGVAMVTLSIIQIVLSIIIGGSALLGAFLLGVKLTAKQEAIVLNTLRETMQHTRSIIGETKNAAQNGIDGMYTHYRQLISNMDKDKDGMIMDDLLEQAKDIGEDAVAIVKKLVIKAKE